MSLEDIGLFLCGEAVGDDGAPNGPRLHEGQLERGAIGGYE